MAIGQQRSVSATLTPAQLTAAGAHAAEEVAKLCGCGSFSKLHALTACMGSIKEVSQACALQTAGLIRSLHVRLLRKSATNIPEPARGRLGASCK